MPLEATIHLIYDFYWHVNISFGLENSIKIKRVISKYVHILGVKNRTDKSKIIFRLFIVCTAIKIYIWIILYHKINELVDYCTFCMSIDELNTTESKTLDDNINGSK